MMFVVDTSILLYAANEDCAEHRVCKDLLEGWRRRSSGWHITWGIAYEFLRVATHPRVFHSPWTVGSAWEFVRALLTAAGLRPLTQTDLHQSVAEEFISEYPQVAGNAVFDARTAILMREHGIRTIYTRDTAFHRYSFIEAIDPVS